MSGQANYPTALDDDTSLHDVVENTTPLVAAHHNNPREAIKALEARVGIYSTDDPDSLDYRLGSATDSHSHNGASGQGQPIDPSSIFASVGVRRTVINTQYLEGWTGSAASYITGAAVVPRTMWLEEAIIYAMEGPSQATTRFDIRIGASSVFGATTSHFMAGPTTGSIFATRLGAYAMITAPSGAPVYANYHRTSAGLAYGKLSITFIFRED